MLNKITELFTINKILIANFSYLSFLQVFNLVLPLITYPYLIRVLGNEIFGLIVFAQTISLMFSLLINFGFNITATKQVSINRKDTKKLSQIVSSILIIKVLLGITSFIIFALLFLVFDFSEHKLLFLFSFTICFNEVFFCQWFFQGLEEMKYITMISVFSRLCFVFLILFLVKDESDFLLVPILSGFGALLNGVISLWIVFKFKNIRFIFPSIQIILFYFRDALPIFWSRLISKVKDQSNTVFIGASIGMVEVAYYDLASKLINIVNSFIETVTIAIFPKLSNSKNVKTTRMFFQITLTVAVLSYLSFIILGKYVVLLIGGKEMIETVKLFPLIGILLLRSSSFFIGNAILIVNNKSKPYVNSLLLSGCVYFILIGVLFLMKITFTIDMFILISVFAFVLEYIYRVYACKKNNLMKNLI